ncbi:MAG: UDP-N-acetylmuramoyl-tripeptide--D-alanyl-D-alanine ligase [Candidatus Jorgensenbacteria bacterium]
MLKRSVLKLLGRVLKILARLTVRRYHPGIVGVTGSAGKTSTKDAIAVVLGRSRRVRAASKSFNNEIGFPLTILGEWGEGGGILFWLKVLAGALANLVGRAKSYPEVLILEYGVDRPGDMRYLLETARPHIGVFTAMGSIPVHVEFFAGPEAVVGEKAKLVRELPATGFAVLNADDEMVLGTKALTRAQVMTFGFGAGAHVRIVDFANRIEGATAAVTFKLSYGGSTVPVRLEGAVGRAHAYAAAAAAAVGLVFGENLTTIAETLRAFKAPPGRLRVIPGLRGSLIIDGTYNASPLAMREALETLRAVKAKRKFALLGDMLEIGKYTLEAHEEVGRFAAKCADVLVTVGLRAKFIAEAAAKAGLPVRSQAKVGFPPRAIRTFLTLGEAAEFLRGTLASGDMVLLKASQSVRLERVVKEIMAEPGKAGEFLVRQEEEWLRKKGLYDEGELG